jgi:SAM-dependent methyltransferase
MTHVFDQLAINLRGKRILDVGCGRGFAGDVVTDAGGAYFGVDLIPTRSGIRMALAGGSALPFSDDVFDGLFCIDAFEHIPDAAAAAREFRRMLRPGGFVFLSVPNYGNAAGLVKKWCETFGRYEKDTWAPFGAWKPQELEHFITGGRVRRLFRGAGFSTVRAIGHPNEVDAGLFPWIALPGMPERIKYRLQHLFAMIGPAVVRVWPGASLHLFCRIE